MCTSMYVLKIFANEDNHISLVHVYSEHQLCRQENDWTASTGFSIPRLLEMTIGIKG